MKSNLPPSKNVEVRDREFPRPMAGSRIGGESIHSQDVKTYNAWGKQRIKATLSDADNPFKPMIEGMPKAARQDKKDLANNRAEGMNPKVPIPTPRPDPTQPYRKPSVFTKTDTKG